MRRPLLQYRSAIKAAADLITRLGIRAPSEIDIELIASHCGAYVDFKSLENEEGRLLRLGDTGLIVVNRDARRSAKWRFVVAHELGHFHCHRQLDQLDMCTDDSLHDWYRTAGCEPEANRFAAELLMPEQLFKAASDVDKPTLNVVRRLATGYQTSLTSTALRFVEFCPEPTAMIVSRERRVAWFSTGEDFKVFISVGQSVAKGTYAGDVFAGKDVPGEMADVAVDAWNTGQFSPDVELYEQSMRLGQHEEVLTLLWHPPLDSDDED